MKMHHVHRLLITALCVSQTVAFAGLGMDVHSLQDTISPFVQHSTTLAQSATAGLLPFATGLVENYKHSLVVHPLETKMITGATLATMGDAFAQSSEPDEPFDKRRASSFMAFDAAYRALQHNVFPWIVQHCQGQLFLGAIAAIPPLAKFVSQNMDQSYFGALEQTLASQLVVVPFMYYPVFFALTGAVQGLTVDEAVDRAKEKFLPLMERNLVFWIPVQFVQFAFIEEGLQIPFLCVCGLVWTTILSLMAGSVKRSEQEYEYCVTGMEEGCVLPDELFPVEEIAHDIEVIAHDVEDRVHVFEEKFAHDVEEIVHDIEVAMHLADENGVKEEVEEEELVEEDELVLK